MNHVELQLESSYGIHMGTSLPNRSEKKHLLCKIFILLKIKHNEQLRSRIFESPLAIIENVAANIVIDILKSLSKKLNFLHITTIALCVVWGAVCSTDYLLFLETKHPIMMLFQIIMYNFKSRSKGKKNLPSPPQQLQTCLLSHTCQKITKSISN